MARDVMTNAEMQDVINAGHPVLYKGKVLKTLAELPDDAQILLDYPNYAYTRIEGNAKAILGYEVTGTLSDGVVPQFDDTTKRWNLNTVSGGGGGSLTIKEVDGTPSISGATTLEVNQADGFVLTNPSGSIARLSLTAVPWANLNKTGSSLADLTTRSATDLNSGTLNDLRLSSNVTLGGNTFAGTGNLVKATSPTINSGITLNAAPLTMSGNISSAAWTTNGIRIKGTAATLTDTSSSGTVAAAYTNVLGGNTIAASSSTTFTDYYSTFMNEPTAGSNVTITNGWALGLNGGAKIRRDSLGTTTVTGEELTNTTAAAAGAQQVSPSTVWTGQGWKTTATAASQTVNFQAYVLPVQGSANPSANWTLQSQINGGGYNNTLAVTSGGQVLLTAGSAAAPSLADSGGTSGLRILSSRILFSGAGNDFFDFTTSALKVLRGVSFSWSSSSSSVVSAQDLILRRNAAADLAHGGADAASPVAQIDSRQNVVGGTSNTAGVSQTYNGSRGTGTGTGGAFIWQIAPAGTSGTSQNAFAEAFRITGEGAITFPSTITIGGTTGNQTIDKVSGTVNIAAAGTTVTVTNKLVTSNSIVMAVIRTNDTTASIKNVVPASGSFTINLVNAATAETSVGFFVINQ